jgi:hypothetical protein
MPRELSDLVYNELWQPADESEWSTVLTEIGEHRLEALCADILVRASEIEPLHYRATALLARTKGGDLSGAIDADLGARSPAERIFACEAMGASGDAGWLRRLATLVEDPDREVATAALVASMRVGSKKAGNDVKEVLARREHADHAPLLRALCRSARDPVVSLLLEDYLLQARGEEEMQVAVALCLEGRLTARSRVRKALAAEPPPHGARGAELVRALRRSSTAEDLPVLRGLFPRENDLPMNIELAVTLVELGDPEVSPIVRAAIWVPTWHRSVLASALLVEIGNVRTLREELRQPPGTATSADLRRVGYALGAWGGLDQLEDLARELRYNSGHPGLQGAFLGAMSNRTF